MQFEKVECIYAFYDEQSSNIYYAFDTVPVIGHGEWAISSGGDSAYDLRFDRLVECGYPNELLDLLEYIPDDIEIDGLEE